MRKGGALAIEEFLEKYQTTCNRNGTESIPTLVSELQKAIDTGDNLDAFFLKGTIRDLIHKRIEDGMIDSIMTSFSGPGFLKIIDLSYNEIGDDGAISISKFIKQDTFLEVLILKSNLIGGRGCEALSTALHYNLQINYLDISDNEITDIGGIAICSMLQVIFIYQINTGIANLFVSGCKLPASSLIALATVLQSNNNIIQLDVSNNTLYTASLSQSLLNDVMTHLSMAIKLNYGLKMVNLSKMGITDYIMCNLLGPALQQNKNIETLNLSCNRITRDGGVALAFALSMHSSINYLKLSCCALQDEGAQAIAKLLDTNTSLKEYHAFNKNLFGLQ
jgi:Ran GTPase-activating protein (RanGAP) involved in mRNA processing and transport